MAILVSGMQIEDVKLLDSVSFMDERGGFFKYYERNELMEGGIDFQITEVFYSISKKNVIRGLHFQSANPQKKIVAVQSGRVWDVVVDLRPNSETYKKWMSFELTGEENRALYIPKGFAHGFLSLEEESIMTYLCDGKYDGESDGGIVFNDKDIGIEWPISIEHAIVAKRDKMLPSFKEYKDNPIRLD